MWIQTDNVSNKKLKSKKAHSDRRRTSHYSSLIKVKYTVAGTFNQSHFYAFV